jgi:hypothetical protein
MALKDANAYRAYMRDYRRGVRRGRAVNTHVNTVNTNYVSVEPVGGRVSPAASDGVWYEPVEDS